MSDTDMAYIGVQACGCITLVMTDKPEYAKDNAKAIAQFIRKGGGRSIEHLTVGEAKARPHFLIAPDECPHREPEPQADPAQMSIAEPTKEVEARG